MAFTVMLRPTSLALFLAHFYFTVPLQAFRVTKFLQLVGLTMSLFILSVFLDIWGYGMLYDAMGIETSSSQKLVSRFSSPVPIVIWNFVRFNVFQQVSSFYGTHPWHWYITNGIPTMLGPFLLILPFGIHLWIPTLFGRLYLTSTALYSILGHKEFRFLAPVHPLIMIAIGIGFSKLLHHQGSSISHNSLISKQISSFLRSPLRRYCLLGITILSSYMMACYFSLIHQRGVIDVMQYLRAEANHKSQHNPQRLNPVSIYFLMPCHSTPLYSYLGSNIPTGWLTCLPPITGFTKSGNEMKYQSETDKFFGNVKLQLETWIWSARWKSSHSAGTKLLQDVPASHLVIFDQFYQNWSHVGILQDYREVRNQLISQDCLYNLLIMGIFSPIYRISAPVSSIHIGMTIHFEKGTCLSYVRINAAPDNPISFPKIDNSFQKLGRIFGLNVFFIA
jgi:phosphatidylinositol glycan class B